MNDDEKEHILLVPKYFYVKGGNVSILSPRQWLQTQTYRKLIQNTGSETDSRKVLLLWNQIKSKLTTQLRKTIM